MRKWCKIVLATTLSAGTLMLSSCIENVEPEGIAKLRGAKADLLTAQISVQAANAAKIEADAALLAAQAKVQEAIAKQEEAKAQKLVYEAELLKLEVELESGLAADKLKAEIAKLEADAQLAAAELEAELLNAKTMLIAAQQAYDTAMKDLAAAKLSLSDGQKEYLAEFVMKVEQKQSDVDLYTDQLEMAGENLADAVATLDEALADKITLKVKEWKVAKAQAELEALQAQAAKLEEALKLDDQVKSWVALQESIEAELKALKYSAETDLEGKEASASLLAQQDELLALAEKIAASTGRTFDKTSGKFSIMPISEIYERWFVPETYVKAPVDEDGKKLFVSEDFYIAPESTSFYYGESEEADAKFDDEIESLSYVNEEYYNDLIDNLNEQIAEEQEGVKEVLAKYDAAVAAYKSGDVYAYFKEHDNSWLDYESFDPEALVKSYNEALTAFEEALSTYEEVLAKYAADDDKNAAEAELTKTKDTKIDAALNAKYVAYQEARDVHYEAYVEYKKAENAWNQAMRAYEYVVGEVEAVTGYTKVSDIASELETLKGKTDQTDDDKARIALLTANLTKLTAADEAKENAEKTWGDAGTKYRQAGTTYETAKKKADETYNLAERAANDEYNDAYAELKLGDDFGDRVDSEYRAYLSDKVSKTNKTLRDYISEISSYAQRALDYKTVIYTNEHTGESRFSVPDFLANDDATALKSIEVKDIVDTEYFLENTVKGVASDLISGSIRVRVGYYNGSNYSTLYRHYDYSYDSETYKDFPLSLPDSEEYAAFVERCEEDAREKAISDMINEGYLDVRILSVTQYWSPYTKLFEYQNEILTYKATIANLPKLTEYIEAVKAAKKVYEDYKAEKIAEVDEKLAKVETEWAAMAASLDEIKKKDEEAKLKEKALESKLRMVKDVIAVWVGDKVGANGINDERVNDVDSLIEALEEMLDELMTGNIPGAERSLADAQDALACTDETDAKDAAQKAYDEVLADLNKATEELAAASAELEAAMTAVKAIE